MFPWTINLRKFSYDRLIINFIFEMIRVLAYPYFFSYLLSTCLIHRPLACYICFLESKECPIVLVDVLFDHEGHFINIRFQPEYSVEPGVNTLKGKTCARPM